MPRPLLVLCLLAAAGCDAAGVEPPARGPAQYVVTLDATWSAATHPDAFPPDPHFSRLTGAAHAPGTGLWAVGERASDGVRRVAETGATDVLRSEVEALAARATYVEGGPVRTSPGTARLDLTVTEDRPLATVVSMIAPSPDWFVGVDGLDLREPASASGDGWADRVVVTLHVYDAGTDDGATFTAPDAPTPARGPIALLGYAPLAGTAVGTLTFERVGR